MILLYHFLACFTQTGSSRFKHPGRNFISLFSWSRSRCRVTKSHNWNERTPFWALPTWLYVCSFKPVVLIHPDVWIEGLVSSILSQQLRWSLWENEAAPFNIVLHKQTNKQSSCWTEFCSSCSPRGPLAWLHLAFFIVYMTLLIVLLPCWHCGDYKRTGLCSAACLLFGYSFVRDQCVKSWGARRTSVFWHFRN